MVVAAQGSAPPSVDRSGLPVVEAPLAARWSPPTSMRKRRGQDSPQLRYRMERQELWDGWSATLSTRVQHDTQREVAAALLRSLGSEKVTVVFEQSPAT